MVLPTCFRRLNNSGCVVAQFPNPHYPKGPRGGFKCLEPSRTLQSGKADADINTIVNRFLRTGVLPASAERPPVYGDLTIQPHLATALQMDLRAKDAWLALPESVRRSAGSPAELESWIKANPGQAIRSGLATVRPKPAPAAPPKAADASPTPPAGGGTK